MDEMFGDDLERARKAILEFFSQSVLLLAFNDKEGPNGNTRTGLYATLGGEHFVITAGHKLENSHLEDFSYQSRPAKWRGIDEGPGRPNAPWIPTPTCHVEDSEPVGDPQDLFVMRIKRLPDKGGKVVPYPLDHCAPFSAPFRTKTVALGFPGDLRDDKESDPYTYKPLGLWSHIIEEPPGLKAFDPAYHFTTRYKLIEGDPMFGNCTRGMSGAPVFVVPPKEMTIADPSSLLLGIEHIEYPGRNTLQATRIEHVIPVVRKILGRYR